MTTISLYLLILRRQRVRAAWRATLPAFAPAGIVLGLAYTFLVLGFDRGRVSVVAPLNATQSLFAVAFAGLMMLPDQKRQRFRQIGTVKVVAALRMAALHNRLAANSGWQTAHPSPIVDRVESREIHGRGRRFGSI